MAEKQVQFYYLLRIIQNLSKVKHNLLTDYVISCMANLDWNNRENFSFYN